jgi:hypothetical protein
MPAEPNGAADRGLRHAEQLPRLVRERHVFARLGARTARVRGLGQVLAGVRERPAAGQLGDLAVAEAGDEQREVFALALGELRQQPQRRARLERVERPAVAITASQPSSAPSSSRRASPRPERDSRYASWIATVFSHGSSSSSAG